MLRPAMIAIALAAAAYTLPSRADDPAAATEIAAPGDTAWRFVEAMGSALPPEAPASLTFEAGTRAVGDAGCNRFGGRFVPSGDAPAFPDLGYTKMACEGVEHAVGNAVRAALAGTYRAVVSGGALHLLAADGAVLARLVPARP